MKASHHAHPQPRLQRLWHYAVLTLLVIMALSLPFQIILTVITANGVFLLSALLVALLMMPLCMAISTTPPVTVDDDGLTLHPIIGNKQPITWDQIKSVKRYTLLPERNQEVGRRAMVGRKNYREAEGIMLIVDGLPLPYRCAGFFAGEPGQTIIALTNRTHTDYDMLVKKVHSRIPTERIVEELTKS